MGIKEVGGKEMHEKNRCRGHVFYSRKYNGPGCNAIALSSGRLCKNNAFVNYLKGELRLCLTHAGMFQAGWDFCPDPKESYSRRK